MRNNNKIIGGIYMKPIYGFGFGTVMKEAKQACEILNREKFMMEE